MRVILDTNVLVAALRSRNGAAYKIVTLIDADKFEFAVSLPLYMEYRDVLFRKEVRPVGVSDADIVDFIERILLKAEIKDISYLWRPTLPDPADEMLLEVAICYGAEYIVSFNTRHFVGSELFGIEAITPSQFLGLLSN